MIEDKVKDYENVKINNRKVFKPFVVYKWKALGVVLYLMRLTLEI